MMNQTAPVIVFGEGSTSVFLINELIKQGEQILWVSGSSARLMPVLPFVTNEKALAAWREWEVSHALETGVFHRVYRNKSFKIPNHRKGSNESSWGAELSWVAEPQFRVNSASLAMTEERLRVEFASHPQVKCLPGAPVVEFEANAHGGKIQFANGAITEFKQFYFCDSIDAMKAVPKLLPIFKNQMVGVKASGRLSALQVVMEHKTALKQAVNTGLMIPMNRDSGETFDRHVFGYFIEPTRSVWTVFLQGSEIEENHEIMKKLRKMKQSLNRAFEGPDFLPEGVTEFMATVSRERVCFEAGFFVSEGELKASSSNSDFVLLSESFGLSETLAKMADHFKYEAVDFLATAENTSAADLSANLAEVEMPEHVKHGDGEFTAEAGV